MPARVCAGRGAAHGRLRVFIEIGRRLVETVFEHKRCDALIGQRAGDVRSLVLHRQRAEAPAGRDDHCGTTCLRRFREVGREGGNGDVPRKLAAVLTVP